MSVLIENMEMPKDCLHCCFKNIGTGYELTLCDLAGWVKMKDGAGCWYLGDTDETFLSEDLYADGWWELPKKPEGRE